MFHLVWRISRSPRFIPKLLAGFAVLAIGAGCQPDRRAGVYRTAYEADGRRLVVEVLDDDLVHFELGPSVASAAAPQPILATPMVCKTNYRGPTRIRDDRQGTLETSDVRVVVDLRTLRVSVVDKTRTPESVLTRLCPTQLSDSATTLTLDHARMQNVYGLGEQFIAAGAMDDDWVGRVRSPGHEFGNALVEFDNETGNVGNAQFPILYAVGEADANYALFADHLYAQSWDFTGSPWTLMTRGRALRWYILIGSNLPDLRRDYMELVGRPPVPPRKAFGLWVSEFGYDDWAELEDKLRTLRANNFPVDGFVLDLQWFGDVTGESESSMMGNVAWDTARFPDPAGKIAELREKHGVGLIPIEESYVSRGRPEYAALAERGYLATKCDGGRPVHFSTWWGAGGLIDWTNPAAGDFWHDLKRRPLIDDGVLGHWTDLGEPERFDPEACYHGVPQLGLRTHRDIHNLYNFTWAESIQRGYVRNSVERRPFILSRSGTSGVQRFGTAMWSGDIGSRLGQLAAHMNAQMHMSFSGIDYFGSDVGGFQRWSLDGDLNELYTQWFANSAAFDVPLRPHTANGENKHETAPDRVGDLASNLENIRQRYQLLPYLYSLAHRAWLYGEPVVPPLVFYYQNDPAVRELGGEKMLGRDLLVAAVAQYGQKERDVYLPAGKWINFHTNEWTDSQGEWLRGLPLYTDGRFKLPMFARAGAVIPLMHVDEKTMNALGRRTDGTRRDELIVRVYADASPSSFTLYEDDGETIAYQSGAVRTTRISQTASDNQVCVTIDDAAEDYRGAVSERRNVVELVVHDLALPRSVTLNGKALPPCDPQAAFDQADGGWFAPANNRVVAKTPPLSVRERKAFVFDFTLRGLLLAPEPQE